MQKDKQPKYEMTKITCACGNVKISTLKFVLHVIRFLQESKNWLTRLDESIALRSATVSKTKILQCFCAICGKIALFQSSWGKCLESILSLLLHKD